MPACNKNTWTVCQSILQTVYLITLLIVHGMPNLITFETCNTCNTLGNTSYTVTLVKLYNSWYYRFTFMKHSQHRFLQQWILCPGFQETRTWKISRLFCSCPSELEANNQALMTPLSPCPPYLTHVIRLLFWRTLPHFLYPTHLLSTHI